MHNYYQALARQKSIYDFEIEKDIERTFPNDLAFLKGTRNYHKMNRVLRAIAYHEPHVGYVQGFNFIAGNLIKLLGDEHSVFWMFINILA